jgi:hypothetical protein
VTETPWKSSIPFASERVGAAAIYCSDGRYNEQFDEFLHRKLHLPRYDRLTIPGGAGCLAGHIEAYREEEILLEQLRFLVVSHRLSRIVLIAHQNCGFYLKRLHVGESYLEERQRHDLARAAEQARTIDHALSVEAYFAAVRDGAVLLDQVDV